VAAHRVPRAGERALRLRRVGVGGRPAAGRARDERRARARAAVIAGAPPKARSSAAPITARSESPSSMSRSFGLAPAW
jgi:hypothetical protein